MRTTSLKNPLRSFAVLLVAALFGPNPSHAHHTTDHTQQQLEYERQQREYWRAQEQRRQEEQRMRQIEQETVRKREEQAERDRRQYKQQQFGGSSGGSSSSGQSGAASQRSGGPSQPNICNLRPIPSGDRNPLVGRWRYVEAKAPQQNVFAQIFQMACPHYASGFDFRDRSLIAQGKPVPASYGRDGDIWWVCGNGVALAFRPQGPDRLQMVDPTPNCTFERATGQR